MTQTEHQKVIAANNANFNEDFVKAYEKRDSQRILAILFVKYLLEYDFEHPTTRKSAAETEQILGDPNLETNGLSVAKDLPDPSTYLTKFPNSIFKPGMKLLDFACGSGIVTELFVPYLKGGERSELYGMDINSIFLEYFNKRASRHASFDLDFKSFQYDVLDQAVQDELDDKFANHFDAIFCTISYHHIHNYELVTKKLATFLRPGGWLFIIDFYNEDVETAKGDTSQAVQHMGGLKIDALNRTLGEIAGLVNVSSAREFRTYNWSPEHFIVNHSRQEILDKLSKGQLPSKVIDGEVNYLIDSSLIYAVGQRA
ncbi:uncharacterized protein SPAPADRAFT_62297 [Spathaspora passalidarum NRRL Y-27907]|uniref:Methyltransferase domain-containing protein n=1 Tax=Spathaspora passalidarum (strain NRRL Y-27907 / 11-Y1) TaxID=619300 RepID=G3AR30_SPAPN|nr:uncharacterized protein SPAPADRAFT_62297 [Spathaspora passalidarum NRRL Y-27907]EGW31691.1 hypothetical protein SPAPADRAFT_62297 [Spathaspora passalidarum NRRL Y-27907]